MASIPLRSISAIWLLGGIVESEITLFNLHCLLFEFEIDLDQDLGVSVTGLDAQFKGLPELGQKEILQKAIDRFAVAVYNQHRIAPDVSVQWKRFYYGVLISELSGGIMTRYPHPRWM